MSTPSPEQLARIRGTLVGAMASGMRFSQALALGRAKHPEAAPLFDGLQRVSDVPAAELLRSSSLWRSTARSGWIIVMVIYSVFALLVVGAVGILAERKVMPVLCAHERGMGEPCEPTVGFTPLVWLAAALTALSIWWWRRRSRLDFGEKLRRAGHLAALGMGVGEALAIVLGPSQMSAELIPPGDERHEKAAAWLKAAGAHLIASGERRPARAFLWMAHAIVWASGAYIAFSVYRAIFALGG